MFRTPNVTMDNRAGTSVIVRILPEPQDVLEGDLANCAGTPSDRVQLHDRREGVAKSSGDRQRRKGQSAWPGSHLERRSTRRRNRSTSFARRENFWHAGP
jgi:hypothetical protein